MKDKICLTDCPACGKENYAINIYTEWCTWCPFNTGGEFIKNDQS